MLLGLARSLRAGYDWFFPYYRDRALALALGVTPLEMLMQAVGAAADPASGGRQMPCHWGSARLNIVSQTSVTASQCLPAVGCAEAARYIGRRPHLPGCTAHGDEVTYVSLGEGATSEGEFWEALNTATRLHLPVLFVVADNGYAISVRSTDQHPAPISEMVRGIRGLHVVKMDGRDYFEVRRKGASAIAHVRAGTGPCLVHALVTRPYSHSLSDDQKKYRVPEELDDEREHDPITALEQRLIAAGALTPETAERMRVAAKESVLAAANAVLELPRPTPVSVIDHVVGPLVVFEPTDPPASEADVVTYGEAIRLTLHEQMARDERIRVFGEDVADADPDVIDEVPGKGACSASPSGCSARSVMRAASTRRWRRRTSSAAPSVRRCGAPPCAEIQFFDYVWPAMNQLRSEAATTRWRSNGAFTCPMVVRIAIGGYLQGGATFHSQSGESIFATFPDC